MKKQQQDSQQPELLKYKEEHTSCTNYATEQKAIIQIYEEKAHRAITKSVAERPRWYSYSRVCYTLHSLMPSLRISKPEKCSSCLQAMNFSE